MEHKNKSFGRIKRHQSDKVLRYSIRKYSFGAASVAVAALMFLGTHAVSADVVDGKNQPAIGAPNPNEEKPPLIEPALTSKNEEIKETEKVEVAKETEEREKPSENKEAVEANSLNNGTSTSTITVTKDASGDKVTEKQRLDKSQLQASITKVQELLAKVNKEKAPASTLAAIQEDLENAKNALNNNELTQAEVDVAAKKLNEKVFVLSSMPKVVAPKTGSHETLETPKTVTEIKHSLETVKEDLQKYVKKSEITTDKPNVTAAEKILENISKQLENTTLTSKELTALLEQAKTVRNTLVNEELRANSGARDSRNGQSMGEGVNFRADGVPVEGALYDVKEYISQDKYNGGGTTTGQRVRTIEKTFMTAKYSTEGNKKYITYDVYFQNDGQALDGSTGNAFWFYPPRDLLYNVGGNYPVGVVSDAYYERYEKKAGTTGILSHNPNNFTQVGGRYTVPLIAGKYQDDGSQRLWPGAGGLFQFDGGPARRSPNQVQSMLKNLKDNKELNSIIRLGNGNLPDGSYSHILNVSPKQNYAYKYHVKMRLKDDVTAEQAKTAGTIAVTTKAGSAIEASQAYVYAARGTSLLAPPTINTLAKYDGTLVSTDRVISGTGVAGATIKVKLQDGSIGRTTVNNQGNWTYTLRTNEKLTQNTKPDATIKADNAISVTQTKNGEESSATSVNVQLAKAISIDTPLQAGREITVKAAHDTGRFYVQVYNNKNDRQAAYQYGVKQEGGRWVLEEGSDKADLIVANGDNVSEKKFTLRIKDANKKTNFPFKITANSVVKVRSHYVNRDNNPANPGNDADQGWITASPATNTNPRITVNAPNTRNYTADGSLTLDGLKRLVTVADKEDDANKTVGRTANENLSVTIRQGNKDVNLANNGYLKKGEYTLTYTTTDAAGATATTNHTITVNYAAVAKPTINLLKGETLTEAEKRSLLQLQDGTSKIDVPSNARVEVTLDTSSVSNTPNGKTATATVVFADNTRTAPIPVNYKVFNTFETVTKVYDFVGVNRNDSPSSYYKNPGGLLPGMSWVVKRDNDAEFKNADAEMKKMLNADGVGTKTYSFGAKYPRGRFTDNPTSDAEKLSYTPTFTHEVFDVAAFNNPQTQKNRVEVNNGEKLSDAQAASAVVKTPSSQALPKGTTYEWVKSATDPTLLTDAEKSVTEFGEITRYVKVTLPKVSETGPSANQVQPYKIIPVTLKVNETVKPTVQMDGRRLTTNAEDNKFVIFRGATFNPTFTVNDNSGKISTMEVSGLPSGTNFVKNTETANGDVQLSGNVTATANATLGTNNVGSVKVTDARGNTETYKFKYAVVDVEVKNTPETVDKGTKLFVPNNTRESKDSHNYVKVVATPNTDGSDVYYPGGMNFKWSKNNAEITNETVFDTPGTITYNAVVKFPRTKSDKYNVDIDGDGRNENVTIYAPEKVEKTVTFKVKPTAPTVTAKDNGDVEITPANEMNVDKVSVTFTPQEGTNPAEVTYTAKKNASGVWEFGSGAPLTVDPTTGVFKLKDRKVKDGTTVTVKALTTDGTGGIQSTPATGIAGNGDAVLPEIEFKNTETDAQGNRVVYITPTEDTNLDVATITDNSNKLLEAVFFDQGTTLTDLGNYGITYNKVIRNGDTITNAPLTLTVNGTLNKFKSANTVWNDDDVIVTRYASAMDAAENNIKDKSGSRDNVASNPYRVVFKALTQATKYTPTVSKAKIERDITQANATITDPEFNKIKDTLTFSSTRGEVKVKKDTTGLTFEIKNRTVQAKQDGSLYITATVVYPDGSRDDIDVPLDTTDANKAKPALTTKEVSIKAAKAKNEQGSVPATEYNRVLNNVTVPQGQPQPTAKEVKNNGLISEVDGKKVVTVGLTFKDNTKKDVTVPVLEVKPIDIVTTFNEKDNTVTIKPNTTVEINDRLQFGIRGKSMALTKTASGYTNSVNDRTITVNQDGSITITLVGEEKFQAGDRIVTRHESNKNGKVDSYETEAFAGLKPVEKVPVINLTNLTPKEIEDVKAAVKKANPSVNTAELQVAANGNVTYRHKGAGVGTSDPTPVITLSETVRERNDAEKIDPTIATLTRYVKETKHTDEQIKNAITGEHIANKAITGEIPTNGGTVVVKVTYTDGSSEDVKVPIIVTPELTPVKNLNDLTNKEKESVKAKIQTLNPTATNIVVKNNGETTLTIPDVTTATLTPAQTVKEADSNRIQPPAVTPVKNTGALTPEEKGKVVEAVKKVNPKATKVEVGEDGSTTVTFEDGTTATLTPDKTVVEDFDPVKPTEKVPAKKASELTQDEKDKVKEKVQAKNPGKDVTVGADGTATVTDPNTGISHDIPGTELVNQDFDPVKPTEKVPVKDKAHLTPEEKKQVADKVKDKNPGKEVTVGDDGTAIVTDPITGISHTIPGIDLTIIVPPVVDIPEFNGGVNGELPDPVELPKVKLIITKWIDEQGNELKPADAKAPAVLGEANEAFEHGEIEGYVFVRTDVNEEGDVVTHVFRKVTPTKPEGNGEQQGGANTPQPTPEVPTDNTERKPETEKPTVPDTKQAEQPTQTVDAQVAPSQNQAVLPNTGTKADRATGALGALSLLGAFGLLFAKKKKDDEEETRNN